MWWQNFRMKIILAAVVVVLVVVIFLLACYSGGRNCTKTGSNNTAPAPAGQNNLAADNNVVPGGVSMPEQTASALVPAAAPAAPQGATIPTQVPAAATPAASQGATLPAQAPASLSAPSNP
eukprot:GHUV01046534.1.p2 GENE.GHUV01046534.1~~GHUV01046534.1.p2  ORF type:complete len:121 (-),score=55.73 GHUV01046534.1:404-766(-)